MIMENSAFNTAYTKLNLAQKEAVDTIEGPVMVIAGPGTGKTQILTLRIANILRQTDSSPENILALTFTEAGAGAMRERLYTYIGQAAYRVNIHTFHEFAGNLIRLYPDSYLRAIGGRPASDLEKVSIIEAIIETGKVRSLRPHGNPSFYVKSIINALALMKREYITPDKFVTIIDKQAENLDHTPKFHEKGAHKGKVRGEYQKLEKELVKNKELLFVYRAYDNALTSGNLYDFEDMIFETVEALEKNEDMLRDLQERYQYILADEHQDVNGGQNRIMELLASFHNRPNLFVVGDEKQAIFRFQGASLENFLFFEEQFPHTKSIALTHNYRSVQKVLDLAQELITKVDSPATSLRVPLTAFTKNIGLIEKKVFTHEAIEDEELVGNIKNLIEEGEKPEEIAVIVRSNKEVEAIAGALRLAGIPANATADGDILYHPITTSVRALIKAVLEPANEEALFIVLHAPYWDISRSDLVRVLQARSYTKSLAKILSEPDILVGLELDNPMTFTKVVTLLEEARAKLVNEAPHRILQFLLENSGFISHLMMTNSLESGRVIRRLYDEIESLVRTHEATTLLDISNMFSVRIAHGLSLNAPYIQTNISAVQVMTAHKSKGLEFEQVFIPHLNNVRWGDSSRPIYFRIPITKQVDDTAYDDLDDERKLLYVAITRTKTGLHLSYAKQNSDGRPFTSSPLLDEIGQTLINEIDVTKFETEFNPLYSLCQTDKPVLLDVSFLKLTLVQRGLSATSLNNYLHSPWNYFYRNVLRIPELQAESAQFGTILHNTLRKATMYRTKNNTLPEVSLLKDYLENELNKLPLNIHEYTRFHERGLEAILVYLDYVGVSLPPVTKEEVKFEARLQTGNENFPEVLLTGNIDRLDYDLEGNLIRVVDYKSGKPKTRGFIEGAVKDGTGDYKRQLTFYALLLSLQENNRLHTQNGLLTFVEADDKGKVHEEAYIISEEEIEALKQDIIRVTIEIAEGKFLSLPCDPKTCDYCELVENLKL